MACPRGSAITVGSLIRADRAKVELEGPLREVRVELAAVLVLAQHHLHRED
eukprot:CAMPEP_0202846558 /NCGR_PEP_ID=MMETSP1389-20130828/73117_1 /ASSEMBLY_ACC=CAM_ASM_000865 /TAXON_ID=302021 /ORGANISM="Rhodomonas sp., Strain CCMP768" /LENGTH=50 /DNA_ID=CAMNT_0049524143 /DNA_START=94 /DNA_END=246 /DNA_ORIENTATION=+